MSERKKAFRWFWPISLTVGFLVLLFRNVEPLKTINELYSAPWPVLMLVFFISFAVSLTIAFREGREITKKREA